MTDRSSRSRANLSGLGNIFNFVNNHLPVIIAQPELAVPQPFNEPDVGFDNESVINEAGNIQLPEHNISEHSWSIVS